MFLIWGIQSGRKDFDFAETIICSLCGQYGNLRVFMTYSVFTFFFIPTFKFNKKYYVQKTCCGALYELNPEVGKRIAKGEKTEITKDDLILVDSGGGAQRTGGRRTKICPKCGYAASEEFDFCPKCGTKL